MKWFIVVIMEKGCPDAFIFEPYKVNAKNSAEAVGYVKSLVLDTGRSLKTWDNDIEVLNLFDCGLTEPVDLKAR